MIYFYDEIIAKTLDKIKDAHDCGDVLLDLTQIEQAVIRLKSGGDWFAANQLDYELRQKYSCIDAMINLANTISVPSPQAEKIYSPIEAAIANLNQDYYGILCDTAIKKGITQDIKQFIQFVD